MAQVVIIGALCVLSLLIGRWIGQFCAEEIVQGKNQLYLALFLVALVGFMYHAFFGISAIVFFIFSLLLYTATRTNISLLLGGILLLMVPNLYVMGSCLFVYSFIAGLIHSKKSMKELLIDHAGILIVFLEFFV